MVMIWMVESELWKFEFDDILLKNQDCAQIMFIQF